MRILSLAISDNANLMYTNMLCLRAVGIDAHCYKTHPQNHKIKDFYYEVEAEIKTVEEMCQIIEGSHWDVIQFFHAQIKNFRQIQFSIYKLDKSKTKFVVYYTGSNYRNEPEIHNEVFNPIVNLSVTSKALFRHCHLHETSG